MSVSSVLREVAPAAGVVAGYVLKAVTDGMTDRTRWRRERRVRFEDVKRQAYAGLIESIQQIEDARATLHVVANMIRDEPDSEPGEPLSPRAQSAASLIEREAAMFDEYLPTIRRHLSVMRLHAPPAVYDLGAEAAAAMSGATADARRLRDEFIEAAKRDLAVHD